MMFQGTDSPYSFATAAIVSISDVKSGFFRNPDIRWCYPDKIRISGFPSTIPSHVMEARTVTVCVWSGNQQCHAVLAPLLLPPSGRVNANTAGGRR